MMEYKGYIAEIEYDDSVDLLHGRVVNAGPYPIVTFEASDVEGLKREFRISIEEYLTICAENNIQPQQPFSWQVESEFGCRPSCARGRTGGAKRHEHQQLDKGSAGKGGGSTGVSVGLPVLRRRW